MAKDVVRAAVLNLFAEGRKGGGGECSLCFTPFCPGHGYICGDLSMRGCHEDTVACLR